MFSASEAWLQVGWAAMLANAHEFISAFLQNSCCSKLY